MDGWRKLGLYMKSTSLVNISFIIGFTVILVLLFATDKIIKLKKEAEAKIARNERGQLLSIVIICGKKQSASETVGSPLTNGTEESRSRNEFSNYISLIALLYIGSGVVTRVIKGHQMGTLYQQNSLS